jgi:hypothetical protein
MPKGDPSRGLLKAILQLIREHPEKDVFDCDWVTGELESKGYWDFRDVKTPARTVNSYFSQNKSIFRRVAPNRYRLISRL